MPYLTRNIDQKLLQWKISSDRKPLILRGARQVGKTQTARNLGKSFSSFVEINFERQADIHKVFEKNLVPSRILQELETFSQKKIIPGQTLLFFDEIQECQKALSSLRYFYEEMPLLNLIAAGSLLEFVLDEISFPVGRVHSEFMYPLSFSEFLKAMGEEDLAVSLPIFPFSPTHSSLPEMAIEKLNDYLRKYFMIGGMPKSVSTFIEHQSYIEVANVQDDLLQSYQDDIRKYAKRERQILNCGNVFARLFKHVGKQIKYTQLAPLEEIKRTKRSLELLEQAMVIHRVLNTQPQGLPLGAEASDKQFKIVFLDVGLGQRTAGTSLSELHHNKDLLGLYEGRIAEQFVGQQLLAESGTGSENRKLYCWMRNEKSSSAEVDYVIARNSKIFPLEVKSGKSGRLKSLHLFLKTYGGTGFCLQDIGSVKKQEPVTFVPLYSKF